MKALNRSMTDESFPEVRVGLDLCSVGAVEQAITDFGDRYLERVYTETELADAGDATGPSAARLAARFAAKEATVKALRLDDEPFDWRDVEVVRGATGAVDVSLGERLARRAGEMGLLSLSVSVTHEGDYAGAVVIAMASRAGAR